MVHCRLLAVGTRTHQSADLDLVMVNSGKERAIDFKIYRLSIYFHVLWIYWWIRPQVTLKHLRWNMIFWGKSWYRFSRLVTFLCCFPNKFQDILELTLQIYLKYFQNQNKRNHRSLFYSIITLLTFMTSLKLMFMNDLFMNWLPHFKKMYSLNH
jgi:hypothetical protein